MIIVSEGADLKMKSPFENTLTIKEEFFKVHREAIESLNTWMENNELNTGNEFNFEEYMKREMNTLVRSSLIYGEFLELYIKLLKSIPRSKWKKLKNKIWIRIKPLIKICTP